MLNPNEWESAVLAYKKLLASENPELKKDKALHLEAIQALTSKLKNINDFLKNASVKKELYEKLVGNYHDALGDIEKLIQKHLSIQEREYYKAVCAEVPPDENLFKLDETIEVAIHRQGDFLEYAKNTPVDMSGSSWDTA